MVDTRKLLVLCFFRYWTRVNGSTLERTDSIMVSVASELNIHKAFTSRMRWAIADWKVGPRPTTFQLEASLTERGKFARHSANRG